MKPVFLIGYMGSGKSTYGKLLADETGLAFVDTDDYIVERSGCSIPELFAEKGESGFRRMERSCLEELCLRRDTIIATGGGMPCFGDNMALMRRSGLTIYLETPVSVLVERLAGTGGQRPLLRGKTSGELRQFVERALEERKPFYEQASCRVDSDCPDVVHLLAQLVRYASQE